MIKARAGNLVVLGLSHENLRRLKDGRPLNLDLKDIGLEQRMFIYAGATEADMQAMMREFIGPNVTDRS